jgi:organic hydroperoxide reductase OsmC/OhrA
MAVKDYGFPVSVRAIGGGRTLAKPPGKQAVEVAVPPELGGPEAGVWSPEDLLVAAVASCYAVTLEGAGERLGVSLETLEVDGVGHVAKGLNGSVFTVVELHVVVQADEGSLPVVKEAARLAEERCLVRRALQIPVHLELVVRASGTKRAAA